VCVAVATRHDLQRPPRTTAGGTTPVRSRKLANAAVAALYYRDKAKGVMRDLES